MLALAGIPFFALSLADPKTALTREDTSFPGRRISLMIDASSSMLSSMPSSRLAKDAPNDAMFFTTVGAARYFVELRMKGKYRDLLALVEFGDQAYVITPFTTDYENILFSMSLIGDWTEFMSFPDQGTVIANAIDQSVGLFRAFDVLDAAGNAMVIFSDGIDAEVTEDGRTAYDVLRDATRGEDSGVLHPHRRARPRCRPAYPTKPGRQRSPGPAGSSSRAPTNRRSFVPSRRSIARRSVGSR